MLMLIQNQSTVCSLLHCPSNVTKFHACCHHILHDWVYPQYGPHPDTGPPHLWSSTCVELLWICQMLLVALEETLDGCFSVHSSKTYLNI